MDEHSEGEEESVHISLEENLEGLTYRDAMTELSQILSDIEGDQIDLDELASKVERAALLLRFCRKKILDTEMQVKSVIDGLDTTQDG